MATFPNHEPNPLIEDNMKDLHAAVKKHNADLGVAFDGDGDRVFFTTKEGETVDGDIMTGLLASEVLKDNSGAKVLYDLRASRATAEAIKEAGGQPIITRVGHSYIKARMREEQAIFAGEVSGHFYFAPWYAELAIKAMITLIQLIKEEDTSLSDLAKPLSERYATSPELNFEVDDKDGAIKRIEDKYADDAEEILHIDGLTVRFPTWWCNVRPSGTEPLLRLKVEANTEEELIDKRQQLENLIGGTPASS